MTWTLSVASAQNTLTICEVTVPKVGAGGAVGGTVSGPDRVVNDTGADRGLVV